MKKHYKHILLVLLTSLLGQETVCRMSGAGAGVLGGAIGFMGGTMLANSRSSRRQSSYDEQPVVYTTVDQRPIHNHYYTTTAQESELENDDYYDLESDHDQNDSNDSDENYEYKVIKVKKQK